MKHKPIFLRKFGAAVYEKRQAAGLTQEELADLAGLHRTYIGGIERGERNLSLENILRISVALKIRCAALVEDIEANDLD